MFLGLLVLDIWKLFAIKTDSDIFTGLKRLAMQRLKMQIAHSQPMLRCGRERLTQLLSHSKELACVGQNQPSAKFRS